MKFLYDISWTHKILALGSLFALGAAGVTGVSAYTMSSQMVAMHEAQTQSNLRVAAAFSSRLAVVEMAKNQAELIAASESQHIRQSAVAAIKASSALDENVQRLQAALPGDANVQELVTLISELKPAKMNVIKAARGNDDAAAIDLAKKMQGAMDRVEELSQAIVHDQVAQVDEVMRQQLEQGRQATVFLAVLVAIGILLLLIISYYAARLFTRPLAMMAEAMGALAQGDLTYELKRTGKDEVGRTIGELAKTVETLNSMVSTIHAGASELTSEAENVTSAATEMHGVSATLHDAVKGMREEAVRASESGASMSTDVSRVSETALRTVESTNHVTEEIKHSVNDFAHFQAEMDEVVEKTMELARTAAAVTSITNTIKEIASQVNLLALNASIEASRAGEHGRGFGVVADEVRNLAKRSDQASGEISSLVEEIVAGINHTAARLEGAAGKAKENIVRLQTVRELTEDGSTQATSMHAAMSRVVGLIGSQQEAIEHITGAINDLCTLSEKTSTQSDALDGLSRSLRQASLAMNDLVAQFTIR